MFETAEFNFNNSMRSLLAEIIRVMPVFGHINLDQVQISAAYCRKKRGGGLLAYVLPLRYRDGSHQTTKTRGNVRYHYGIQPTIVQGREILYILNFLLPRFLNLKFRDKLETIIHELYHISPEFNGDLRRLKGRSYIHGNSLKEYEKGIRALTDAFLGSPHEAAEYEFLKLSARELEGVFGRIKTLHFKEPRPHLLHIEKSGFQI